MIQKKETRAGYLFLIPWLVGFFGLTVIPMIASLYFSLTSYDLIASPKWIGFQNYVNMCRDVKFQHSLRVTFTFVFLGVPLQLVFALILAVIFKKNRPGVRYYRAIYYLPSLFGGSIAVASLWRQLFNKTGLLNRVLQAMNFNVTKNWISSPDTAIYTLILLQVWQFGASMVVFLSALKQIPQDYYEAATIDGAGKVKQFFSITLPLLTPMVFFNIVMQFIHAFQSFTPAYIISAGTGGPMNATMFYTLNIYLQGFSYFKMGYACALAWFLVLIIGAFTGIIFGTSNKWVYYD